MKQLEASLSLNASGIPIEFRVLALRDYPMAKPYCDDPAKAAAYWRRYIATNPAFNYDAESFYVLSLDARCNIRGHTLVSIGTVNACLCHPREVFRPAIVACASAVILMHNHPSGDPSPSMADIKSTMDVIAAGEILKIEVLDHVIIGKRQHSSLRQLGYFNVKAPKPRKLKVARLRKKQ